MTTVSRILVVLGGCGTALWGAAVGGVNLPAGAYRAPVKYEHGYFLARDRERGMVASYDKSGKALAQVYLNPTEGYTPQPTDGSIAPDGMIAVSAMAMDKEGAYGSTIVWIGREGKVIRLVRTSPYGVGHIAFDDRGHLWTAGRVYDEKFGDTPKFDVLREYDGDGRLARTMLPNDSFPQSGDKRHPAFQSFLVALPHGMGFYSVTRREWVEVSDAGEVVGRWRTPDVSKDRMFLGAIAASDEGVYVSYEDIQRVAGTPNEGGLLRLNKTTDGNASFEAVSGGGLGYVAGSDGGQLIFSPEHGKFSWASLR